MKLARYVVLLAASMLLVQQAQAMTIKLNGGFVRMSGTVIDTDCDTLKKILAEHKGKVFSVALRNSFGGDADAGYCVGKTIREYGLATRIEGFCESSCSRMWLGGVRRYLSWPGSHVGLHGNYDDKGKLLPEAPARLRAWIPEYAPNVNRGLMNQWTELPINRDMMVFYKTRAELCHRALPRPNCARLPGFNAKNAGLSVE